MKGDGMHGNSAGNGSGYPGKNSAKVFAITCGLKRP